MALFGSSKPGSGFSPSALSGSDKMMLFGAMLRDLGTGGGPESIMGVQQMVANRQQLAAKQAAQAQVSGLFGSSAPRGQTPILPVGDFPGFTPPPQSTPSMPSIADPAVIQQLLAAKNAGADIGPAIELLKANKAPDPQWAIGPDGRPYNQHAAEAPGQFRNPQNINGWNIDQNNPANEGRYFPNLPAGVVPDGRGGAMNIQGFPAAMGAQAAAVEAAKAPYTPDTRTNASGAPVYGVQADRFNGPPLVGQSPADAAAAKAAAESRATAAQGLPQAVATADYTLGVIDQLKNHPALGARTGATGVLPAIPGSPGVSFDAMVEQLKGQVFLEAFKTLKGGGAITEVEGQKAQQAIARLNRAQSKEDFTAALDELAGIVQNGKERAAAQTRPPAPRVNASRADIAAEMRRRKLLP